MAGRRITLSWTKLPAPAGPGIYVEEAGEETFRLPQARRLVRRFVSRGYDYCALYLRGRRHVVTFALTERGSKHVDEQLRASSLFGLLMLATAEDGHFLTPEALLSRGEGGRSPACSRSSRSPHRPTRRPPGRSATTATAGSTPPP